jgi:hypothetical protein
MVGREAAKQDACAGGGHVIPARRSGGRTIMTSNKWTGLTAGRAAAVLGLAGALLVGSGHTGLAQSEESASKHGLEGTWFVQVTPRVCATGAPLGTFNSLVTFHEGGTLSESTSSPAFAIGQRISGHGTWNFAGHHTYDQRLVSLINFDTAPNLPASPGFFAGWYIVTHTIELIDANHATSSGTNEFYKADGTLYRTGCSTAVSERFE